MCTEYILHIGTHKTGSTSFQQLLGNNRRRLRKKGIEFYKGLLEKNNHVELFFSTIRPGVETLADYKFGGIDRQKLYYKTRNNIRNIVKNSKCDKFIFSAEGLSYLRTNAELERLKALFPDNGSSNFKIIVVLRDKKDFLYSYANQIKKQKKRKISNNTSSGLYVEEDSWLADFDELLKVYRDFFGEIDIISYDKETTLHRMLESSSVDLYKESTLYFMNSSNETSLVQKSMNRIRRYVARQF